MTKPNNFVFNSDYATMKQAGIVAGAIQVAAQSIPSGDVMLGSRVHTLPAERATMLSNVSVLSIGRTFQSNNVRVLYENTEVQLSFSVHKVSDTQIRAELWGSNPRQDAQPVPAETFSYRVANFISPFDTSR